MEILKKALKTIKKYSMLSEGDGILLGLSGGADSVCLGIILHELRHDFNLTLNAVYVDHGLRPIEVENEKKFCKDFCDKFKINFFTESVDVKKYAKERKMNQQEAARELRYKIYEDILMKTGATKIALGHNADDQVETVLIHLMRGAGYKGLSGMPPVRSLELRVKSLELGVKKNLLIIRPLIEVDRKEIEDFLSKSSKLQTLDSELPFVIDSSNLKSDYLRNWMRHVIIPALKERNPSLTESICRMTEILREEDAYLELVVTKTLMRLISRKSNSTIELFFAPLETMEKPILRRVLKRAISETKRLKGIDFKHIEDIIKLIKNGKSGDRIFLPKGIRVVRGYSLLAITSEEPVKIPEYELQPPCEVIIKEAGVMIKASLEEKRGDSGDGRSSVLLDAGSMSFPLKIRRRSEGDFFFPMGFGKKRKLQDFFVDEKIPRDERDRIPIVLSDDDIVWVAGYRADDRFKVTDRTEKFLRLIISNT